MFGWFFLVQRLCQISANGISKTYGGVKSMAPVSGYIVVVSLVSVE